MIYLTELFKIFVKREEGQTLTEYGLIIALVSIALVAGLIALAGGITGVFNTIIGNF
jgi:pilus assembly protein Flp/PilA